MNDDTEIKKMSLPQGYIILHHTLPLQHNIYTSVNIIKCYIELN